MRSFSAEARKKKKKIGLVPTMGTLHRGHLELVRAAKRRSDVIVVSIFVNPIQFGPREDLNDYPRDLEGDLEELRKVGVSAVFAPEVREMFPADYRTYVNVEDLSKRLCGRSRPTHFRGVATVVLKLFNIVTPQVAVFSRKDYQQLVIIRKMVRDLNLDLQLVEGSTVRDRDGLALSSRHRKLTPEQRPAALTLRQALLVAEKLITKGERSAAKVISNMREVVRSQPGTEIEYIAVCNPETLADLEAVEAKTLVALAVRVDEVRLIDNLFIDLVALQKKKKKASASR
jgi:pantoate--beta-alanine ligase